jgi:signal transduction histidine kinase
LKHKIGVALIYLSVAFRALVEQSTGSYLGLVVVLLAIFGGMYFGEQTLQRRLSVGVVLSQQRFQIAYLFVEMCLVIGLLMIPPTNDYPALLFIPLSLQAVLFYHQRSGFWWITVFTLVMAFFLTWNVESVIQGLVMALLFGGICFLVGGYAHMIRKAELARIANQQTIDQIQEAHQQLQSYAAQRQEISIVNERVRLGRELHDSVTQTVFSMNLAAQTARLLWSENPLRVNAQFDRFLELADDALHQIQTLVAHLGPQIVVGDDLITAIELLADERQERDGFQVEIEVIGNIRLPDPVNAALYRILQEALANIAKHAGVLQAAIRINLAGNPQFIEIEDRGRGFDLAASRNQPGHIGLAEMIERAEEIDWNLSINTQLGRGTCVRIEKYTDGEM